MNKEEFRIWFEVAGFNYVHAKCRKHGHVHEIPIDSFLKMDLENNPYQCPGTISDGQGGTTPCETYNMDFKWIDPKGRPQTFGIQSVPITGSKVTDLTGSEKRDYKPEDVWPNDNYRDPFHTIYYASHADWDGDGQDDQYYPDDFIFPTGGIDDGGSTPNTNDLFRWPLKDNRLFIGGGTEENPDFPPGTTSDNLKVYDHLTGEYVVLNGLSFYQLILFIVSQVDPDDNGGDLN